MVIFFIYGHLECAVRLISSRIIGRSVHTNYAQLVIVDIKNATLVVVATVVGARKDGGTLLVKVKEESIGGHLVGSDHVGESILLKKSANN